jgi:hypothetical protein
MLWGGSREKEYVYMRFQEGSGLTIRACTAEAEAEAEAEAHGIQVQSIDSIL